jgi:phosphopantetheinyl transferase
VGQTTIGLGLRDTAGQPVIDARIKLEANMSHAGMAPVFADATEEAPGHYGAAINLSMAGDWIVVAHVTLADGRKLDHQFEINGVASQ